MMRDERKGSVDPQRLAEFKADLDAMMAGFFGDWPKGCIVRGPFVACDPIEQIEIVAECIGADPEAGR